MAGLRMKIDKVSMDRVGQLLGDMTSLEVSFIALKVPVENALVQWSDEEYLLAREMLANLAARDAMRAALLRQMGPQGVLLAPACGVTAFRHRERSWAAGERQIGLLEAVAPLTWVNLLGLPALVIPFELSHISSRRPATRAQ